MTGRITFRRYGRLAAMMAVVVISTGCGDGRSQEERVSQFCQGIKIGEPYDVVAARMAAYDLQANDRAPNIQGGLAGKMPEEDLRKVIGILVEASGSISSTPRPVCVLYHNDSFLGGDSRIVLVEFKADWRNPD